MFTCCHVILSGNRNTGLDGPVCPEVSQIPLLGTTLLDVARSVTRHNLRCPVEMVVPDGWARRRDFASAWPFWIRRLGRLSRDRWLLLTDAQAVGKPAGGFLAQLSDRLASAHLAFLHVRNGAHQYQEQVTVGGTGQVTDVARKYLTDLAVEPCEPGPCRMVAVQATLLRKIVQGQTLAAFAQLQNAAATDGLRSCHLRIALPIYDLRSNRDVVRLQADMFAYHRDLLPRSVRIAGADRIVADESVAIDSSALVRGPVVLGRRVRILSRAVVLGPCTIGDDAVVGSACVVRNSVILAAASIEAGAHVDCCVVGKSNTRLTARPSTGRSRAVESPNGFNPTEDREGFVTPSPSRTYRILKRATDIILAATALLLLLPLFPLIALAIKLNSRGPVFYVDRRQTVGGRSFGCLKFRTMIVDAKRLEKTLRDKNAVDGLHIDIVDDPRVTRVGQFLRQTNLDEVPQFINVLLGQMSIVGPRPSPDNENRLCPAWREARLSVRPGITGLWQVCRSRYRGANDFQEWIYYDIEYSRWQSIGLDLRIMCRTLQIVAVGFLPGLRRLALPRTSPMMWWRPKQEGQAWHGGRTASASCLAEV